MQMALLMSVNLRKLYAKIVKYTIDWDFNASLHNGVEDLDLACKI